MKITRNFLAFGFLALFSGCFSSCKKDQDYDDFLIEIDSIAIAEPILANRPFKIKFYGYIGHNGCYHFSEFEWEKRENTIMIEVWGKLNLKSTICSDVMVCLNGEELNLELKETGNYNFRVKQPDGTFLEQQIQVKLID